MAVNTYRKPRLGSRVWGLSSRWLAICPWNSMGEFWVQIPFIGLIVGLDHIELILGVVYTINVDVRWRWR